MAALASDLPALEWIYLTPNPAYSRDLAMGASTLALSYPPQSQSINPAGFTAFERQTRQVVTVFLNPGGAWQTVKWWQKDEEADTRDVSATIPPRLLINSLAVRWKIATLAGLLSQPVMKSGLASRYEGYEQSSGLDQHENSLLLALNLHRRISVGGRVDRYYRYSHAEGEGYSYGVILRPRNVTLAVQYQRFPASGDRVWHPLDRRRDQAVSAGLAFTEGEWLVTAQVMNLTASGDSLRLEPRVGAEWRPWRYLGMRAGLVSFSDNERWAWTSGISLVDANWFRDKFARLPVPDDILQAAIAVLYDRRTPTLAIGSLTLSVRL